MKEQIFESREYLKDYLPWAGQLIKCESTAALLEQIQSDRDTIIRNTIFTQPPLNRLTANLTLLSEENYQEDTVALTADFDESRLKIIGINSSNHGQVSLNPESSRWPVQYREGVSRAKDLLVRSELSRDRARNLVRRTSSAMLRHIVHRVPIAIVPEEAYDYTIDESEMQRRTIITLRRAGIETYGDLGILSLNQLKKVEGLGKVALDDIKAEFWRLSWLSAPYE